jgi:hypothetical protein
MRDDPALTRDTGSEAAYRTAEVILHPSSFIL